MFLFFHRALLSLLAASLYLDLNTPKDMRLTKPLFVLTFPKSSLKNN